MAGNRFSRRLLAPRFWLLWLALAPAWLLAQLPYRVLLVLGRAVGWLMYLGAAKRRRIIEQNIRLCFPQLTSAQQLELVKKNFASSGIAVFEMLMSWWWPLSRLRKLAHVNGLEHLQQAQSQGRGVILLSFHFTTLEIGAALLGQFVSIDGMYRRHSNAAFDYVQRRGRERHNADAIAIERGDIKAMLNLLRQGRAVWYAPDQDYGRERSIFVPFFGVSAATITATAKFARLGKALVVPFTQYRLPDGKGYELTIHRPLTDFPTKDDYTDCRRINALVEKAIRQQPEQYLWAHRRFKTRPDGEASVY